MRDSFTAPCSCAAYHLLPVRLAISCASVPHQCWCQEQRYRVIAGAYSQLPVHVCSLSPIRYPQYHALGSTTPPSASCSISPVSGRHCEYPRLKTASEQPSTHIASAHNLAVPALDRDDTAPYLMLANRMLILASQHSAIGSLATRAHCRLFLIFSARYVHPRCANATSSPQNNAPPALHLPRIEHHTSRTPRADRHLLRERAS